MKNNDFIDRQALINELKDTYVQTPLQHSEPLVYGDTDIIWIIENFPSTESIVYCKECRWGKEACGIIECFADLNAPTEYHGYDWFCPNGEVKK